MRRVIMAGLLLGLAATAQAHVSSVTYAALAVDGDHVSYELKLSSRDLYEALHLEKDRVATLAEVTAGTAALEAYVTAKVKLTRRGAACTAVPRGVGNEDAGDGFYAVVTIDYACPRPVDIVELRYDLFFDVDRRHESRTHVSWRAAGEAVPRSQDVWLKDAERDFRWDRSAVVNARHAPGVIEVAERGPLGVLESPAELLMLLALIAAFAAGTRAPYQRSLLVVAAFALGHVLGLIGASRGWVSLAPRLTDAVIAASIIYVAVENLVTGATATRWLVGFAFGAVHGVGFARAAGADGLSMVASLAAVAQVAVACAALWLLGWLGRGGGRRWLGWTSAALALGGLALLARAVSS